ncbi:hypothetical protein HZB01_00940 [Candidatus Woesearchaeota archaeon]|nr:hypothetical protein [Candidatus Woesearchaeota archaeon]
MKQYMLVKLLIPDNVAITTFHTLEGMGFSSLKKISRQDYYSFETKSPGDFVAKITKVDILVNANKHKATVLEKLPATTEMDGLYAVHVQVLAGENDCGGLLAVLQTRLGFSEITSMERGVFWTLFLDAKTVQQAKKIAQEITLGLLVNEQFQRWEVY